jgi:hypothetical protein
MPRVPRPPDERPDDVKALERKLGSERERAEVSAATPTEVKSYLALWLAGATYVEIAAQMHVRVPKVRLMIEKALADTVDDDEDRTIQRQRASLQLDRYLRSIAVKALDSESPDQPMYLRLALQITDRKIRLQGLDAPTAVMITQPSDIELREWVAAVAIANGASVVEEGDPFALEEGEDGTWQ